MVVAELGVSMPVFVLGLLLAYLFAIVLKDTPLSLPPSGRLSSGIEVDAARRGVGPRGPRRAAPRRARLHLGHLPDQRPDHRPVGGAGSTRCATSSCRRIALGTIPLAIIARITRSSLLEVLGQDYVRTARAKGLQRAVRRAPPRDAQRAAAGRHGHRPPAGGAAVGRGPDRDRVQPVGRRADAVRGDHGPRLRRRSRASRWSIAVIYVVVNLVVDISYGFLDPRVRLPMSQAPDTTCRPRRR